MLTRKGHLGIGMSAIVQYLAKTFFFSQKKVVLLVTILFLKTLPT